MVTNTGCGEKSGIKEWRGAQQKDISHKDCVLPSIPAAPRNYPVLVRNPVTCSASNSTAFVGLKVARSIPLRDCLPCPTVANNNSYSARF